MGRFQNRPQPGGIDRLGFADEFIDFGSCHWSPPTSRIKQRIILILRNSAVRLYANACISIPSTVNHTTLARPAAAEFGPAGYLRSPIEGTALSEKPSGSVGQAFQPDTSAMLHFVLRTALVGDVECRP